MPYRRTSRIKKEQYIGDKFFVRLHKLINEHNSYIISKYSRKLVDDIKSYKYYDKLMDDLVEKIEIITNKHNINLRRYIENGSYNLIIPKEYYKKYNFKVVNKGYSGSF